MATRPSAIQVPLRRDGGFGAAIARTIGALDHVLTLVVVALVGYGLWIVSEVKADGVSRQALAVAMGVAVAIAILATGAAAVRRVRWPAYGVVLALLLVVAASEAIRGSRRWIDLGFFQLQPSEPAKIVLAVTLAAFLGERARSGLDGRAIWTAIGITAVPAVLVFAQPDFGTSLVFVVSLGAALFFSGARWNVLTALGVVGVSAAVLVLWILPANGVQILKPYQVDRLVGFVDPGADPSGSTYNVNQSITAVGAGGLTGRGSEATQTTQEFLPEHDTDFIFSALAETHGFLGAGLLLVLQALLVWRGLRIIAVARSHFEAVLAGTLVSAYLFQVVVNTGMTMGIAPVVGVPLPFVSYGGSSMVASLALVGMLQAIHARSRLDGRR